MARSKKPSLSLSSAKKTITKNKKSHPSNPSSPIVSLPFELITKILALVASNSCTDIFNVQQVSKHLFHAANDDYIFRNIAIDKAFERCNWFNITGQLSSFIERCKECKNAEVLYRVGLTEFFGSKQRSGIEKLMKAAEEGQVDANYTCGCILLCSMDEHARQQGLTILSMLKKSHPENVNLMRECRERLQRARSDGWLRPWRLFSLARGEKLCNHTKKYHYTNPWLGDITREVEGDCENCEWDNEVDVFLIILY